MASSFFRERLQKKKVFNKAQQMADAHVLSQEMLAVRKNFAKTLFKKPEREEDDKEMMKRIREFDWASTDIGNIEEASISMLSTISLTLSSSFPITVFWGPSNIVLYNDTYIPVCGAKHPSSLGMKGELLWAEVWDIFEPMIQQAKQGTTVYLQDSLLHLTRNGYLEESYFTYSFAPILDDYGHIDGVFTPVVETTKKVIAERRLNILREVAAQTSKTMSLNEACQICASVFAKLPVDLPFSLI